MHHHSTPPRAVCYYRMSTDRQEDSVERQRSQVLPYAEKNGYAVVGEYIDLGVSGSESSTDWCPGVWPGVRMVRSRRRPTSRVMSSSSTSSYPGSIPASAALTATR